jgi:hypothetical protein
MQHKSAKGNSGYELIILPLIAIDLIASLGSLITLTLQKGKQSDSDLDVQRLLINDLGRERIFFGFPWWLDHFSCPVASWTLKLRFVIPFLILLLNFILPIRFATRSWSASR